MLGKLLKHEFKATARWFLPAFGAALLLGVVGCGIGLVSKWLPQWMIVVAVMIYTFMLTALFILVTVITIWRFYKNLLTSEGYLMFTLPVSPTNLIWSKFIVATVWLVGSLIVAGVSVLIVLLGAPGVNWAGFWPAVQDALSYINAQQGMGLFIVQIGLISLAGLFSGILMFYVSMAIGQLSNKHRIAVSVGAYLGIYTVVQIISTIIGVIMGLVGGSASWTTEAATTGVTVVGPNTYFTGFLGIMWLLVAFTWVLPVVYFLVTRYLLTKKLNLA
ncbi:MAG: hypothetical protein FWC54_06660 [Actinomycetia bacterium]|nr:hypothetical protein [Actinomycetes bacterium]